MRSSAVAVALLLATSPAYGFADSAQFFADPSTPHGASLGAVGEGIYFTGAPRFAGLDCGSCHTGGPEALSVRITADPPGLFSDGYAPGASYALVVELLGEQAGRAHASPTCTVPPSPTDGYAYVPCNNNGFAL